MQGVLHVQSVPEYRKSQENGWFGCFVLFCFLKIISLHHCRSAQWSVQKVV